MYPTFDSIRLFHMAFIWHVQKIFCLVSAMNDRILSVSTFIS